MPESAPPVSSRQQAADSARQLILNTALRLFARQGFAATSTRAIAGAAGVAEGLMFHYFPTKRALLLAIAESDERERSPSTLVAAALATVSLEEGLRRYAHTLLAHLRERADLMAVLAGESQLDGDLSTAFWESIGRHRRVLASWIDERLADGDPGPAEAAAATVVSSLSFFFLEHRRLSEPAWATRVGAHVDGLTMLVVDGLRAQATDQT